VICRPRRIRRIEAADGDINLSPVTFMLVRQGGSTGGTKCSQDQFRWAELGWQMGCELEVPHRKCHPTQRMGSGRPPARGAVAERRRSRKTGALVPNCSAQTTPS